MDTIGEFVAWLVIATGFVGWAVFIPQIRLLLKVKESRSISLGMAWGSFGLQATILTHALLKSDWPLVFSIGTSILFLSYLLCLIHYYRWLPGGRR